MSTIAELLVKIGADNSGLKKSLSESQNSIQTAFSANPINEFTGALTGATDGISGMITKISGIAALAAGGFGLGELVKNAVDAGASVYQLSNKLGITSAEAVELSRTVRMSNGDMGSFATSMMRMDKELLSTGESGQTARKVIDAVGISMTDGNGKLLPLNKQLEQLSIGFKKAQETGQQEEFVMHTLGARGLSLIGTLQNYNEVKKAASEVTGVGLNPEEMFNLQIEMKKVQEEAYQVGLAFGGALAPVAEEILPPIMTALSSTAKYLAENKAGVIELGKEVLGLAVGFESIKLLTSGANAIGIFWKNAEAQAIASAAAQETVADVLSASQEKSISRAVAASNKGYAKMEADGIKAAQSLGLSAEETATIITEKSVQIAEESSVAAEAIRVKMTEAFLQVNAAAIESAVVVNESIASTGITATLAGEEAVTASGLMAEAAGTATLAERELAVATALPGEAAAVAGETTVGAMATAGVAVRGLLTSVWALMGGWLGLIAIIGYGTYKAVEAAGVVADQIDKNYKKNYNQNIDMTNHELDDSFHNQASGSIPNDADSHHTQADYDMYGPSQPVTPEKPTDYDFAPVTPATSGKKAKTGKSDAEKELEKLQKEAQKANDEILKNWQKVYQSKEDIAAAEYQKELDKLNESKSANTAYDDALKELNDTYYVKKRISAQQQADLERGYANEAISTIQTLTDLQTAGLRGSAAATAVFKKEWEDALKAVDDRADTILSKINTTENVKDRHDLVDQYTKQGVLSGVDSTGTVTKANLHSFIDREKAQIDSNKRMEKQDNIYKDWKSQLDEEYNHGHIENYSVMLNDRQNLDNKYLIGQQGYMSELQNLWSKTNHTMYDDAATVMSDLSSNLTNVFDKFAHGTASAMDIVHSFTQSVIDSLIKIQVQAAAASITSSLSSLFGGYSAGYTSNGVTYQGPTMANGSFISGKAAGGMIYGPGTGTSDNVLSWLSNGEHVMSAASTASIGPTNLEYMNRTGKIPGFATGGLVTGAPLSSMSSYSGATVSSVNSNQVSGGVSVIVNNNGQAVNATAKDNGINSDGIREIIIDLATDGVLNKVANNRSYANNLKMAMG